MIPFDLHYQWPVGAYLLPLALIILCLYVWLSLYRKKVLDEFATSDSLLHQIAISRSSGIFWSKAIAITLVWILGVFSWMQPVGNGHYPEGELPQLAGKSGKSQKLGIKKKAHDVIFLIDASASMDIKDARLGKTRLEYAKDIVDSIVGNLNGESASLHAFTSTTTQLSPLTMDYLFIRLMLKDLHINEGDIAGTNIVKALTDMRKQYFMKATPKLKTLVILTDGGDTSIDTLQGKEREKAIDTASMLLGETENMQLRVYTVGVGSQTEHEIPGIEYQGKPVRSRVNEDLLRKIALAGRGNYYYANDYTPLDLAKEMQEQMNQDPQYYEENEMTVEGKLAQSLVSDSGLVYDQYFQIPLALALLLLSFVIFCPDVSMREAIS